MAKLGYDSISHCIYNKDGAASAMAISSCECLCVQTVGGRTVKMCPLTALHKIQNWLSGNIAIETGA